MEVTVSHFVPQRMVSICRDHVWIYALTNEIAENVSTIF